MLTFHQNHNLSLTFILVSGVCIRVLNFVWCPSIPTTSVTPVRYINVALKTTLPVNRIQTEITFDSTKKLEKQFTDI